MNARDKLHYYNKKGIVTHYSPLYTTS